MLELNKIHQGDCLELMKTMPDNSVDSIVTDPPYGLSFMGKKWDYDVPSVEIWKECLRVLKPGGYLLSFAGTRTQHRMAVNIEDAGFEIRDMIAWVYGSGFPKSHNIGKAIDKCNGEGGRLLKFVKWYRTTGMKQKETNEIIEKSDVGSHYLRLDQPAIPTVELWKKLRPHIKIEIPTWVDELVDRIEAEREVIGKKKTPDGKDFNARQPKGWVNAGFSGIGKTYGSVNITAPATEEAKKYEGWGTALKPALEPITVARKPFKGTVANNVLKWGTGGININDCRVEVDKNEKKSFAKEWDRNQSEAKDGQVKYVKQDKNYDLNQNRPTGRFPANLIHDGSDEVVDCFPESKSQGHWSKTKTTGFGEFGNGKSEYKGVGEKDKKGGSAARFFYCAKASKSERNKGCEGLEERYTTKQNKWTENDYRKGDGGKTKNPSKNNHPTVKPTKLMQYLVRLVTPKDGICLDPFMGSGSTGKACVKEGFDFIGIELNEEYVKVAQQRIKEDAGYKAEGDDGIPPTNKLVGIFATFL